MAIGRMQMNRQLYGLGSYFPPENGREKFGLGSKLKKFARKIIPNEVSEIAVKAAPFVAPFNPLLAGYMAGIGGFDQTGRIGSSLKSGLLTYGAGQLARQIGGAGFQEGFNPFSNVSFSGGIMSGLGQTFTSPVSGAPLFGQSVTPVQPAITPTQQDIASGTSRASEIAKQAGKTLSERTDIDQFGSIQDYLAQTDPSKLTATKATRGYMDITKDLFSGDFTTMGNAAKELGGKALKDIYTTPVKPYVDASGNLVDSKLDKTAVIATLSAIPSYLDAKKAADDAGIEEFDEATYNAERDKYMERYKANLPASSFGIQAAANGGRIGYGDGTKPSAEENTPSQEIINRRIAQIKDMSKRGADIDTIKSITGASDQMIKDVLGQANGGRIGYREGTPREGIVSLTDEDSGVMYRDPKTGEPLTTTEFLRRAQEDEDRDNVSLTDEESGVVYEDPKTGKPLTTEEFLRMSQEDEELDFGASSITLPKKKTFRERSMEIAVPKQINREMEDKFENYLKKLVTGKKDGGRIGLAGGGGYYDDDYTAFSLLRDELMQFEGDDYYTATRRAKKAIYGMKDGGRMGFMMGTEVPMRQNQGGITELDYRKTGGFVPVGVKERADDVPAMLSKNEFVFTADAVRGAGGGDINKGAKMMYAKMKALEGKVKKFKKTKKKKVKV
jgi:hypothetical protein